MSFDFAFSEDELEKAAESVSNPYLSHPSRGLELVARLISQPSPDRNQADHQNLLALLHQLVNGRFADIIGKNSLPCRIEAIQALRDLEESLANLTVLPDLANKIIVGIGGSFSAGKSRLINTLLGCDLLPEALEPTTAIPSFITRGREEIVAVNNFNSRISLSRQALQAITHAFQRHHRLTFTEHFGFAHLIKLLLLQHESFAWANLAFLDTPGYSKADGKTAIQQDRNIALNQLSQSDHVVWLINAKNGTLRSDDIDFLRRLDHPRPIFFVMTQADLIAGSGTHFLLEKIRKTVRSSGLQSAGLAAWGAPMSCSRGNQIAGDCLYSWLSDLDHTPKFTSFKNTSEHVLDRCIRQGEQAYITGEHELLLLKNLVPLAGGLSAGEQQTLHVLEKDKQQKLDVISEQISEFRTLKREILGVITRLTSQLVVDTPSREALFEQGSQYFLKGEFRRAFEFILQAAELGDTEAQYQLAQCYFHGNGTSASPSQAAHWYLQAAEQEHGDAQFALARCYDLGQGVSRDQKKAVYWYAKAARQKHAGAQFNLAVSYARGEGVPKDESQAIDWYQKAADQGHAKAQFNLALRHDLGQGLPKDERRAVSLYQLAARQGHGGAQFNLAVCYAQGQGVSLNQSKAVCWYEKAAEQGHSAAQFNLAVHLLQGQDVFQDENRAIAWFQKAAEEDLAEAQYHLALRHGTGRGVRLDDKLAAAWYRKAAEQGHARAQFNLALAYDYGRGVSLNQSKAVCWYEKAAEQGLAGAQFNLAVSYAQGDGVPRNENMAMVWFEKAARQGHAGAQSRLKHSGSRGLSKDKSPIIDWSCTPRGKTRLSGPKSDVRA